MWIACTYGLHVARVYSDLEHYDGKESGSGRLRLVLRCCTDPVAIECDGRVEPRPRISSAARRVCPERASRWGKEVLRGAGRGAAKRRNRIDRGAEHKCDVGKGVEMKKTRIMPADHPWDWSMPVSFSQGWKTDNIIWVGGQVSADKSGHVIGPGDIEKQTHNVFGNIRSVLQEVGADMADLVKLNTYYVFDGEDDELVEFWERMTRVRMEYLADPGPIGTAVRVPGLAYPGLLIEADAIAVVED